MKRFTHRLRENKGLERPTLRMFVDTEARRKRHPDKSETQTLWFGWTCYEHEQTHFGRTTKAQTWKRFTTAAEFWALVDEIALPKKALYVYAHNWDYDAAMIELQAQAELNDWVNVSYVRSTHFLWAKFRREKSSLIFVDTLNYFPVSLTSLGESMPVPKLTMPGPRAGAAKWDEYCKRDVEVLRYAVNALIDVVADNELGNFAKTAASQAFNAYKHRYMVERPLIINDPVIEKIERDSYHGGRVEVFNAAPIEDDVYYLDVNSMYPYVMKENVYPYEKWLRRKSATVRDVETWIKTSSIVAECLIETETPIYPKYIDTILCFPIGQFWATLTTPEIEEALKRGHLKAVGSIVVYRNAPLFREYVTDLYALRRKYQAEGNKAFATVVKLLLNSLYGKFGQRGRRWLPCPEIGDCPVDDFLVDCMGDGRPLSHRLRFGQVIHEIKDEESFDSMPVIAAHVTAFARIYLWQLIEKAGEKHVFYCDTDSLFCDPRGFRNLDALIDPGELGLVKVEGKAERAHFRGPKYYQWGTVTHRKGIRANALEIAPDVFEQAQFESYDRALAGGHDGQITVRQIIKRVTGRYRKGDILPDGSVRPFRLTEAAEIVPG